MGQSDINDLRLPGPAFMDMLGVIDQAHGWVIPRPDGQKANCPGPAHCWTCHLEKLVYETRGKVAVVEALVIKPGDKVLLLAGQPMPPEQARGLTARLKEMYPEVDFTIVVGMTGVQAHQD